MILNLINYILILMHRCRNMLLIANKVTQLCVVHAALQRLTAVNQAVNNCSWGCYDTCRRRLWLGAARACPQYLRNAHTFINYCLLPPFPRILVSTQNLLQVYPSDCSPRFILCCTYCKES